MLYCKITSYDLSTPQSLQNRDIEVVRVSKRAIGGPETATLKVRGNAADLYDMMRWLRYGVTIYEPSLGAIWWGYVHESSLDLPEEGITIGYTLEDMYNHIAVSYTTPRKLKATTAWAEDADSVARYGRKSKLITVDDIMGPLTAQNKRDLFLSRLKVPVKTTQIGQKTPYAPMELTLECRGWWSTLSWELATNTKGEESYKYEKDWRYRAIGWGTAPDYVSRCAQGIYLKDTEPFYMETLEVRVSKKETTADLIVSLVNDDSGKPGTTVYDTCNFAATLVPDFPSFAWVTGNWNTKYEIQPSTKYWLVFSKNEAYNNIKQYYIGGSKQLGYSRTGQESHCISLREQYRTVNTPITPLSWVYNDWPDADKAYNASKATECHTTTDGNNYDTNFRIAGTWTIQKLLPYIADMAQFITSIDIEGTSTKRLSPYQAGDKDIRSLLEEWMELGTDDGRRLIATINENRVLRIYPEPLQTEYRYVLKGKEFYTTAEHRMVPALMPYGEWVRTSNIWPNLELTNDLIFIERIEYDGKSITAVENRDDPSPWEII